MTTSLAETLAGLPSIETTSEPFAFVAHGQQIVGSWDIVKATSLYPTAVEHVDKKYAITVSLDAEHGTYDFSETHSEKHGSLDGGGLSVGTSKFKGKSASKEFSFSFGGVNKTDEGISMKPVAYSFETSRIKAPLFAYLDQLGWEPAKKGLLSRLFRH